MLKEFQNHINTNLSFLKNKKLLLAVSGGIDSMVLVHLMRILNFEIILAHCNFNLRENESEEDEIFIKRYSEEHGIRLFTVSFDTKQFAADSKQSIQLAARELRYSWFYQLLEENKLDYLLTAHHLNDSLETFLINLTRGTGIEGLAGIPVLNHKTVRPLLPFSRDQIDAYARENQIKWREDSSNMSDKYLRNNLRHNVVPILKNLNPAFMEGFRQTLEYLSFARTLVEDASVLVYKQVVSEKENQKHINIAELKRLPNFKAYLYQWLAPFGFTAWNDIYNLVDVQSGKQVFSKDYRLLKDREVIILEPVTHNDDRLFCIDENTSFIENPVRLQITKSDFVTFEKNENILYADYEKLKFPLVLRKWQGGDYFYPIGMSGKKKKISKFFKDIKLSLSDKENKWILCSENQIVWVLGKRSDERFKVDAATTNILKIELL